MRALEKPTIRHQTVYQTCINSIEDEDLLNRLNLIILDIVFAARNYEQKALMKDLYTIPPNNCDNNETVLGRVTKKELKMVYSSHMVSSSKPARKFYDLLLSGAHLGRCPFCGFGHVYTLDHYLPKSKYPELSVLPLNLVPSCRDCNTGKRATIATTSEDQDLHPYYDHGNFINDQWLYAEIQESSPITITFFVDAPTGWDDVSRARTQSHFEHFKLASRYAVEASNEFAILRDVLIQYEEILGQEGVKQHLQINAQSYASQHTNSWQTAMYQALAVSDWYCGGGFQ